MQRVWLLLLFPQLLEGSHNIGCGYRLRFPSHLHPPLDELLYKFLSAVHWLLNSVNHERQDEADKETLAEGDPQHLVLAQTKSLSDPLDVGLVPHQEADGLLRLL